MSVLQCTVAQNTDRLFQCAHAACSKHKRADSIARFPLNDECPKDAHRIGRVTFIAPLNVFFSATNLNSKEARCTGSNIEGRVSKLLRGAFQSYSKFSTSAPPVAAAPKTNRNRGAIANHPRSLRKLLFLNAPSSTDITLFTGLWILTCVSPCFGQVRKIDNAHLPACVSNKLRAHIKTVCRYSAPLCLAERTQTLFPG